MKADSMVSFMNSQLDPFLRAEQESGARAREYFLRGKIVAICEAVLREEIGVIAASRKLSRLGFDLFLGRDADFELFDAVDSETDHLPVDSERQNWSRDALARKDEEIAKAESASRDEAFAACRKLIHRLRLEDGA
jgi:hypothetical protein